MKRGHFLTSAESATNPRVPSFAFFAKDGTHLFVVVPAVPNTNRGLFEELFLLSRPPAFADPQGHETVCFLSESRTRCLSVGSVELVFATLFPARHTRAFSLLLCTGKCREVRLFLGKSRAGIGHSVYTRSENALAAKRLLLGDGEGYAIFLAPLPHNFAECLPAKYMPLIP
jgi:hypothetical protein